MAHVSFKIVPRVTDSSLYAEVDKVISLLQASPYRIIVGPSETTIEGPLEEVVDLCVKAIRYCQEECGGRVLAFLGIEDSGSDVTFEHKLYKYRSDFPKKGTE